VTFLYRDAQWLRQKYEDEKISQAAIGQLLGVSCSVIQKWMKKHGIQSRPIGYAERGEKSPFWKGGPNREGAAESRRAYMRRYLKKWRQTPIAKRARVAWNKTIRHRRVEFIRAEKLRRGCARCGYKKNAFALQFHHRKPSEKLFSLYKSIRGCGWTKIKAEMDKCEVLCANCHAELHDVERQDQ
jgi:hypothetical protein